MKVFFNFSARSDEQVKELSLRTKNKIVSLGHKLTYDCFSEDISRIATEVSDEQVQELFSEVKNALQQSQIIILELSTNSFTQGYILNQAIEMQKPVIGIHLKDQYSIFAKGISSTYFHMIEYDSYNLEDQISSSINDAKENLETRFNVYLPPDINNYLQWAARRNNSTKSSYVRDLLREQMETDRKYHI